MSAVRVSAQVEGSSVDQAQLDLQLKVWKELAIGKQMLVRVVTDALKLDPNAKTDELKKAFDAALKKVTQADIDVAEAREKARAAITEMEKKLLAGAQAQAASEATAAELKAALQKLQQQVDTDRATASAEIQKLKERVVEKEKALKAVNTTLADTPENIVRKMKALKKEKQDEADARRQVEASFTSLRADKQKQDQRLNEAAKLATQYRELHALTLKLQEQLKPLLTDEKDLPFVAELDTKLLEAVEQSNGKGKK